MRSMRSIKMKLSDSDWSCGSALMYIFFSDNDRVSGEDYYPKVVKACLLCTLSNPDKNDGHERLDNKELDLIKRLVKSIRLLPAKITGESRLAPIVWIKLAIQISFTGIPIANKFMRHYGEWRNECQHSRKLALVVKENSDADSTTKPSTKSRDSIAYSLDVFLLTDIAEFNQLKHTYSIQYKAIDINDKGATQKIEIPTAKARTKKSARDQIGENICRDVEWCINEAANLKLGLIKLYRRPKESKFTYDETRAHLLERLREKFRGRLKGSNSDNAYLRAITLFVTCKGCKRSIKAPKQTKTKRKKTKPFPIRRKS